MNCHLIEERKTIIFGGVLKQVNSTTCITVSFLPTYKSHVVYLNVDIYTSASQIAAVYFKRSHFTVPFSTFVKKEKNYTQDTYFVGYCFNRILCKVL